ncbi:urease accessory protein UreE [Halioglobus japonicus]|uniref:Urease accessory protein UreE n=1 Tax=Halioglobus japonicus TaxID=930805 RepID=A0AAP8SMQ5_9GAMM|nr:MULTISPECIES: urease accessory protein UreE [Halioglobus]AQA17702.1 urease accessory protein UreE [Halioglobus japonicus]KZX57101.1 urease accessory protein UreE [Halioglobus sp. HI00S01]PLW85651.1 urease accessory protein UreE [Halioglobus japonicus]GHD16757.1 urease accessory protein UreE [Halioglobus japonicus]
MLEVYERQTAAAADNIHAQVVLDHLQRERGRFKAESSNGEEVRIFLERGQTLQVGEILKTRCGKFLQVDGAREAVLEASTDDALLFSRACYHLGNRHTKVQIGAGWLRISPDHVLEEMLSELGLATVSTQAVFVPESGAYARGGHGHHH